jgi:hypothetical protein
MLHIAILVHRHDPYDEMETIEPFSTRSIVRDGDCGGMGPSRPFEIIPFTNRLPMCRRRFGTTLNSQWNASCPNSGMDSIASARGCFSGSREEHRFLFT